MLKIRSDLFYLTDLTIFLNRWESLAAAIFFPGVKGAYFV